MEPLDAALVAKMKADTGVGGLNTLSSDGIYQLSAPETVGTPPATYSPRYYTVFQELLTTPDYAFGNRVSADSSYYQIKHFAIADPNNGGPHIAGMMADRCRTLLTNPTLNVSGKTVLSCSFNRSVPAMKEWDEANGRFIFSKGGIYEVWVA